MKIVETEKLRYRISEGRERVRKRVAISERLPVNFPGRLCRKERAVWAASSQCKITRVELPVELV